MTMTPLSGTDSPPPSAPPTSRVTDIGNGVKWVGDAFKIFTSNPLMWIVFVIMFFVINLAMAFLPLVGQLVFSLISPMIMAGVVVGCRAIENGEGLEIDHFIAGFTGKTSPLLMLGVFYLVATIVIVVVIFGVTAATIGTAIIMNPEGAADKVGASVLLSALFIALVALALSVPLMMAYWFAVPLVQFDDVKPGDALKMSFFASLKNFLPFLLYGIVMLVLLIVAMIPFGLGLFVFLPVMFATVYTSYKDVFHGK